MIITASMRRILRTFTLPAALCWCCSFCVTDFGDRLDVYRADPNAFGMPIATLAVWPL